MAAFFDNRLFGQLIARYGGDDILVASVFVAAVGATVLTIAFTVLRGTIFHTSACDKSLEARVRLARIVILYCVAVGAKLLRLITLGTAFGADRSNWGSLQALDQWIGYLEDLRFLALALLLGHVVRRRTARPWLVIFVATELVLGATSGFIKPLIWPLVVAVFTLQALDSFRTRHALIAAAATALVISLVPAVLRTREDRAGGIGASYSGGLQNTLGAMDTQRQEGFLAGLDVSYQKFFGRQTEVATAPGLIWRLTPEVIPYEGLDRFLSIPLNLIPRAFWPDKPILSRGQWFSTTYRNMDQDTTTSSAMTIFGEGYIFSGWSSLIIAMATTGVLLALFDRILNNQRFAFVYLSLTPTLLEIEPELSSYIVSLLQRTTVFVAAYLLISHRRQQVRSTRVATS